MEIVLHLADSAQAGLLSTPGLKRIYWGAEFCQTLIPGKKETITLARRAAGSGIRMSLVTPPVTDDGLEKVIRLLGLLRKMRSCDEVIVNDWGVLRLVNLRLKKRFALALGRCLTRQQRHWLALAGLKRKPFREAMESTYIDTTAMRTFLLRHNIRRVEFDNVTQGIRTRKKPFCKSIYLPYVHISTTRFCPMDTLQQRRRRIGPCKKECLRRFDLLSGKGADIIKVGNTAFYKNLPQANQMQALARMGFDRIVIQPLV